MATSEATAGMPPAKDTTAAAVAEELVEAGAHALRFGPDLHLLARLTATLVLDGALVDRIVVDPPKQDGVDNVGDPLWVVDRDQVVIGYCDADGYPFVRLPDGEDALPDWVERYAARLLAAARESRRLAAEYVATRPAEPARQLPSFFDADDQAYRDLVQMHRPSDVDTAVEGGDDRG